MRATAKNPSERYQSADDMLAEDLEAELLVNAGVYNVVLRRDEIRQLMLSSPQGGGVMVLGSRFRAMPPYAVVGVSLWRS